MYNIAVCDDEKNILDSLFNQLMNVVGNKINNISPFVAATDLIHFIGSTGLDTNIIFLDIRLIEANGIDTATRLLELNPYLQIIFISGYDDYYLDVYDVEHLYFIRKPISDEILLKAFTRAEKKLTKQKKEIFVIKSHNIIANIRLNEILYFEKALRKILIHTTNGIYSMYAKYEDIETPLNELFFRCHNSFIINLSYLERRL